MKGGEKKVYSFETKSGNLKINIKNLRRKK